jgi:hypothetical protein
MKDPVAAQDNRDEIRRLCIKLSHYGLAVPAPGGFCSIMGFSTGLRKSGTGLDLA